MPAPMITSRSRSANRNCSPVSVPRSGDLPCPQPPAPAHSYPVILKSILKRERFDQGKKPSASHPRSLTCCVTLFHTLGNRFPTENYCRLCGDLTMAIRPITSVCSLHIFERRSNRILPSPNTYSQNRGSATDSAVEAGQFEFPIEMITPPMTINAPPSRRVLLGVIPKKKYEINCAVMKNKTT